jgi:hypothetical protein
MSARLAHLENSNGALSADARPQFPTLARALNVIVAEVARCYLSPSKSLFWFIQRLFNREWRQAKSTVFSYLKKEVEKERITLSEEQSFGGVDSKDPDNVNSVLSLLVKDEHLSKLRGEKPLSTVSNFPFDDTTITMLSMYSFLIAITLVHRMRSPKSS